MPVAPVLRGSRIVYEFVPFPPECKLRARRREDMTPEELRAELKVLLSDREDDLHREFCVNRDCPARR